MKLRNIAIASALVAGNLFAVAANATVYYYDSGTTTFLGNMGTTLNLTNSLAAGAGYTLSWASGGSSSVSLHFAGDTKSFDASVAGSQSSMNIAGSTVTTISSSFGGGFSIVGLCISSTNSCTGGGGGLTTPPGGPSSVNLTPNSYALRSVYDVQTAALNAGLSYDCNVFDKEGFCLSTGGRYSVATSPETKTTSGLLIGSYKYDKNIRLGAWVDQNLSTQNTGGINLSNSSPLFGVFGAWTERNDGLGYEVKVSAGYCDKDADVTRTSTNVGAAQLHMRGISTVSSYGLPVEGGLIAAPYVGVKYTSISRSSYTEAGSGGLTYDNLNQESTTAVAGAKLSGKIDAETSFVVSAGVEHDVNHHIGQYSAGSSNSVAFNPVIQKTRPVVSAGVYYDIDKTQRLGLNATVRQEAFQSTSSTTALATYTVGF